MLSASDCKLIRFIDPQYNDLFYLLDGELLEITHSDGEKRQPKCQYIGETHVKVGRENYHICQLAEILERNGSKAKPVYPLTHVTLDSLTRHQREMVKSRKAMREAYWTWRFIIRDEWDGEKDVPRVSMKWENIRADRASVKRLRESMQVANQLRACLLTSVSKVTEKCSSRDADKTVPSESLYDFAVSSRTLVHYVRIHIDRQVIVTVYCCRRTEIDTRHELVAAHARILQSDKFTIDHDNGFVLNEYYNPDSSAGGELVHNKLSFIGIADIARKTSSEEAFWDCFDSEAKQTCTSITDKNFRAAVLAFLHDPADFRWRDTTTTKAIIALAQAQTANN